MKRCRAFTLVELIIAMIITGLVMSSVVVLLFSIFKNYELHQDITEAKQRGQIAIAVMQPLVLNAGLGLPVTDADFQNTFQWSKNGTVSILSVLFPETPGDPKNFSGFIQLANNEESVSASSEAPAFWVVYTVPSGAWVLGGLESLAGVRTNTAEDSDDEQFSQEIQFTGSLSSEQVVANFPPTSLRSWIAFPSAMPSFPFTVAEIKTSSIKVRSHSASTANMIPPFDEIRYVRAAKIFVEGGVLKINHMDGSGAQPIADGIAGMWCSFNPQGDRLLTVQVLARAGTPRGAGVQGRIEGWPAAAEAHWGRDTKYRYAVVTRTWRVRN